MVMMKVDNVSVSFADKQVLKDLTLAIGNGQIVSILGPNGSGKSTLLKALSYNVKLSAGHGYLDDQDIAQLSPRKVAQRMAVLPQSPEAPKDLTVRDLVEYGRYPHQHWWRGKSSQDDDYVQWALQQTGLEDMAGRIVSTLSGGERQRVWIAMALAQRPEILLLDEPTTYLDICHQLEIMELLSAFHQQHAMTVVMVLHDMNQAARYSDYIVMVHQGTIFAVGTPEEVMTPDTLRTVFGVESVVSIDNIGKPIVQITGLTKKRGK